jgi:hypothetical protein
MHLLHAARSGAATSLGNPSSLLYQKVLALLAAADWFR